MNQKIKHILRKSIYPLLGAFLLIEVYVFIRIYFFASCVIPTYSMSPTLLRGDYICVSLNIPGHRSFTEEPTNGNRITVHREKGVRAIEINDIVIFNFPYSESRERMIFSTKQYYCKRCVATPGTRYAWQWKETSDSVYLPQKGDIIAIDSANFRHYHKCIEYETNQHAKLECGNIYLSDSIIYKYCFQHDYYFMRGDYTSDSYDSRFWGLLPDDFILGVGQFIWFSENKKTGQIRWNRLLKKL